MTGKGGWKKGEGMEERPPEQLMGLFRNNVLADGFFMGYSWIIFDCFNFWFIMD